MKSNVCKYHDKVLEAPERLIDEVLTWNILLSVNVNCKEWSDSKSRKWKMSLWIICKGVDLMKIKVNSSTYNFFPNFCYHNDGYEAFYIYRFPIIKRNRVTTLEGILTISADTGIGKVDVYDMDHNVYAPFYYVESGNYNPILKQIHTQINKELKSLRIKKHDEKAVQKPKKGDAINKTRHGSSLGLRVKL